MKEGEGGDKTNNLKVFKIESELKRIVYLLGAS